MTTTWEDLEKYQEIERRYQQALEDFKRQEATYDAVMRQNRADPTLPAAYEELQQAKANMESLWNQLIELRRSAATQRRISSGGGL